MCCRMGYDNSFFMFNQCSVSYHFPSVSFILNFSYFSPSVTISTHMPVSEWSSRNWTCNTHHYLLFLFYLILSMILVLIVGPSYQLKPFLFINISHIIISFCLHSCPYVTNISVHSMLFLYRTVIVVLLLKFFIWS